MYHDYGVALFATSIFLKLIYLGLGPFLNSVSCVYHVLVTADMGLLVWALHFQ